MPVGPVYMWSKEDKIVETIKRSKQHLGPVVGKEVDALLSPENLAIMAATLVIWAASHLVGVGEVVDVILLLVGAFMLGPAIVDVAENALKFGKCIDARSEQDLDVAARAFAYAVIKGGITTVMAILLRRGAKTMQAKAGPGASWLEVARPRGSAGLPAVGADPQPEAIWSKPPIIGTRALPAGQGKTSAFGRIYYSLRGTATEQQLALLHEMFHRMLSPRFILFRTFRARLRYAGYARSAFLRYLEEAMAETYTRVKVFGAKGLLDGVRFPVANEYVSIGQLANEGFALGTIIVGGQRLAVALVGGPPAWAAEVAPEQPAPQPPQAIRIPEITVKGGYAVTVPPGGSLSAIAKQQYGDFNLWPLIYDLNKTKIGSNPNRIKPGTSLLLLRLSAYTGAEVADARRRAPGWKHAPL